MRIYRLENVIQPYAWGSHTAIADLLGQPGPTQQPQAELWMGTHPKGPSMVVADDGHRIPLQRLIERHPVEILGQDVARRFGPTLPYLFKVLAADRPLSIQAHPSKEEAKQGFSRENHSGLALNAPDRNYRDDNHKPEIICALTPFWGLNGFRSIDAAADLMAPVCPRVLNDYLHKLKSDRDHGLKSFFETMLTLSADQRQVAALEVVDKAKPLAESSPVYRWMVDLAGAYPADMGILSPALLNLICLEPGQAMYLPAGQLHAYLDGVGIELMANSDNVLRGGLTQKHIDVPELLRVVRFVETSPVLIQAAPLRPAENGYECPAEEFYLSIVKTATGRPYLSPTIRSVEILLCTEGAGRITGGGSDCFAAVAKGDSFLVPAGIESYSICGDLTFYKAAIPLQRREATVASGAV